MEAAAVDTTPVSSPDLSPAAPATVAPGQSSSTSQRPTTPDELASWMRSDAATEEKAAADKAAAATVQPAPTDPNAVPAENPDAKQGPIPLAEHKKILENARVERDTARNELQQTQGKLSQLLNIPQAELADVVQAARQMGSDPVGHTFGMIKHLLADPTVGPQVRSELARAFGGLRGSNGAQPPAQPEMPQPDVQIVDAAGNVTGATYSDKQLEKRDAWNRQQLMNEFNKELLPIKQEREQAQRAAKAAETHRQIEARADDLIGDISEMLDISDNTPKEQRDSLFKAVNELMAGNPQLSVHKAASQVRKTHIVPKQKESATRDALDTIHKKAAGNTAGNSGSATPLKRPTNADELAAYMRSLER